MHAKGQRANPFLIAKEEMKEGKRKRGTKFRRERERAGFMYFWEEKTGGGRGKERRNPTG